MRANEARRILGVRVHATPADVKAAYRQRVKAWHPDRFGNDADVRAQAEAEVRRIIEAYQVLQLPDEEPEVQERPRPDPEPEPAGASMFTVHPEPRSWASPRRSRREELEDERRMRREYVRRGAVLLGRLVLVVLLWRSVVWVRWLWSEEPPAVRGAALTRMQNALRFSRIGVSIETAALADRTACFAPLDVEVYEKCLSARALERLAGGPVTTIGEGHTPAYRRLLCSALQHRFEQRVYDECVAEVDAAVE